MDNMHLFLGNTTSQSARQTNQQLDALLSAVSASQHVARSNDGLMSANYYELLARSQSSSRSIVFPTVLTSAPAAAARRFPILSETEARRTMLGSDTLSQLDRERALTGMSLQLRHATPPTLPIAFAVAARKRSLELALDEELRELRTQEALIRASKRRCLEKQASEQQERFLRNATMLPESHSLSSPMGGLAFATNNSPALVHQDRNPKIPYLGSQRLGSPRGSSLIADLLQHYSPATSRRPSNTDVCSETAQKAPLSLGLPCDKGNLTDYQQLARQQLQLFEAGDRDIESATKGRNRRVVRRQVGIQCRHCSHLPPAERAKGSTIYPSKLEGIYQAAQNMTNGHLSKYCKHIPEEVRTKLITLGNRKSSAGGGREYWTNGAKILGVTEKENGLFFKK